MILAKGRKRSFKATSSGEVPFDRKQETFSNLTVEEKKETMNTDAERFPDLVVIRDNSN